MLDCDRKILGDAIIALLLARANLHSKQVPLWQHQFFNQLFLNLILLAFKAIDRQGIENTLAMEASSEIKVLNSLSANNGFHFHTRPIV